MILQHSCTSLRSVRFPAPCTCSLSLLLRKRLFIVISREVWDTVGGGGGVTEMRRWAIERERRRRKGRAREPSFRSSEEEIQPWLPHVLICESPRHLPRPQRRRSAYCVIFSVVAARVNNPNDSEIWKEVYYASLHDRGKGYRSRVFSS